MSQWCCFLAPHLLIKNGYDDTMMNVYVVPIKVKECKIGRIIWGRVLLESKAVEEDDDDDDANNNAMLDYKNYSSSHLETLIATFWICRRRRRRRWYITLFRFLTMFYGTDNIPHNILHIFYIQYEYREYFVEYCQSHRPLLWIWIMLCSPR